MPPVKKSYHPTVTGSASTISKRENFTCLSSLVGRAKFESTHLVSKSPSTADMGPSHVRGVLPPELLASSTVKVCPSRPYSTTSASCTSSAKSPSLTCVKMNAYLFADGGGGESGGAGGNGGGVGGEGGGCRGEGGHGGTITGGRDGGIGGGAVGGMEGNRGNTSKPAPAV